MFRLEAFGLDEWQSPRATGPALVLLRGCERPLRQAVALAFVLTNHISWRVLREEIGLSQATAIETTVTGLEAGLFRGQA
jgi:hypothetical protein